MKCPSCESCDTGVLHTIRFPQVIYRKRQCKKCSVKFHTEEQIVDALPKGAYEKRLPGRRAGRVKRRIRPW